MLKALHATTPLDGRSVTIGKTSLWVVAGRPLYSLSVPLGDDAAFESALSSHLGLARPVPGQFHDQDTFRLCGLAQDQFFLMGLKAKDADEHALKSQLQDAAYVTDQSDSWVTLQISGDEARSAMERISPINLSVTAFAPGSIARTSMEHLSAIVMAEQDGSLTLLSPISSAESFWHAVEQSLVNVS